MATAGDPHAWETAKENYAPVASGRAPNALAADRAPLGKAAADPPGAADGRR
jgi:hypothetical protein